MEKKENNEKKGKSWIEKNAWWIAVGLAIFFLRLCSDLSRH